MVIFYPPSPPFIKLNVYKKIGNKFSAFLSPIYRYIVVCIHSESKTLIKWTHLLSKTLYNVSKEVF